MEWGGSICKMFSGLFIGQQAKNGICPPFCPSHPQQRPLCSLSNGCPRLSTESLINAPLPTFRVPSCDCKNSGKHSLSSLHKYAPFQYWWYLKSLLWGGFHSVGNKSLEIQSIKPKAVHIFFWGWGLEKLVEPFLKCMCLDLASDLSYSLLVPWPDSHFRYLAAWDSNEIWFSVSMPLAGVPSKASLGCSTNVFPGLCFAINLIWDISTLIGWYGFCLNSNIPPLIIVLLERLRWGWG